MVNIGRRAQIDREKIRNVGETQRRRSRLSAVTRRIRPLIRCRRCRRKAGNVGSRFRCGDRRGGLCRHVHAAPAARHGICGARAGGRQRRRRHLVLEPLSRRPLRRREHGVLLPVLRGAAAGVGVERALRRPARDPALCQPRRRPLRPQARHRVQRPREVRRLRRGRGTLGGRDRGRQAHDRHLLHHGDGLPLLAEPAEVRGRRELQGPHLPHRQVAARGRGLHRQARRRHRHRLLRRAVDPDHRQPGEAALRVPAHGQLRRARPQQAARPRARAPHQGRLCRPAPARPPDHDRHRLRLQHRAGARDAARGSASASSSGAGSAAGCRFSAPTWT